MYQGLFKVLFLHLTFMYGETEAQKDFSDLSKATSYLVTRMLTLGLRHFGLNP